MSFPGLPIEKRSGRLGTTLLKMSISKPRKYLVIGGGIAGVCCAEELCRLVEEEDEVTLITSSDVVKAVTNWKQIGKVMETFDVREKPLHSWIPKSSKLNVVRAKASSINTSGQRFTSIGLNCVILYI